MSKRMFRAPTLTPTPAPIPVSVPAPEAPAQPPASTSEPPAPTPPSTELQAIRARLEETTRELAQAQTQEEALVIKVQKLSADLELVTEDRDALLGALEKNLATIQALERDNSQFAETINATVAIRAAPSGPPAPRSFYDANPVLQPPPHIPARHTPRRSETTTATTSA